MSGFKVSRITLKKANEFVAEHHRHNDPVRGSVFQFAAQVDGVIAGVCIAGRPVARKLDDGTTIEFLRTCVRSDVHFQNCNSWMYGHARKVAALLGFPLSDHVHLDIRDGVFATSMRLADWRDVQTRAARLVENQSPASGKASVRRSKAAMGNQHVSA